MKKKKLRKRNNNNNSSGNSNGSNSQRHRNKRNINQNDRNKLRKSEKIAYRIKRIPLNEIEWRREECNTRHYRMNPIWSTSLPTPNTYSYTLASLARWNAHFHVPSHRFHSFHGISKIGFLQQICCIRVSLRGPNNANLHRDILLLW